MAVTDQDSPQRQPDKQDETPRKRTRTRTGCLNCRRKKRKCDERRPTCGTCGRRDERCEWGLKISFHDENAQGLERAHPSMKKMSRKRPREFEILDVTAEVIRDYDLQGGNLSVHPGGRLIYDDHENTHANTHASTRQNTHQNTRQNTRQNTHQDTHQITHPNTQSPLPEPEDGAVDTSKNDAKRRDTDLSDTMHSDSGYFDASTSSLLPDDTATPVRHSETAVQNLIFLSQSRQSDTSISDPLQVSLGAVPMDMISDYLGNMQAFTPEGSLEDGVFLPGSAYHELHSTLRNHLIQEVKSNVPTRPATPVDNQQNGDIIATETAGAASDSTERPSTAVEPPILKKEEEIALWRNWFDEIAPWLDKFDNERHFQHIIPTMAASHDHLRYSILALSSRQLELKETTRPTDRSLALYQQAIHLLLPHLPTRSTEVIASCVILCVLEMLSCSPKAWRRHLDGCASLITAVGIHGFVGGVEQALFWCFARMDVCGGLISSVKTLIPVSHWASKTDLEDNVALFRSRPGFDSWANYMVYLVAQVLDLLAPVPTAPLDVPSRTDAKFRARWLQLWEHISNWHALRPAPLHSIMTIPSSDTSPFPTILFSNPGGISGNQLYHTASILMLQNQPPNLRLTPKPRSLLWHARHVCAISISNNHHGAWTNSVQPLWIAGRCMSHPAEHKAILDLLDKIERESGWGTRWRAEDLKEFWGDLGE